MPKGYSRMQRIADLIQTAMADILQVQKEELCLGWVTVTSVKVSPDLSFAKIYVSVLEDEKVKESLEILNKAAKELRYQLAHAVDLRITPELKFIYDDSVVRGHHISSLINDALKKS